MSLSYYEQLCKQKGIKIPIMQRYARAAAKRKDNKNYGKHNSHFKKSPKEDEKKLKQEVSNV